MLEMVSAMTRNGVIGNKGKLVVKSAADMRRFRLLTMNHPAIMGWTTWDQCLEVPFKPLPGRENVVLTHDLTRFAPGATLIGSPEEVLKRYHEPPELAFIIGGNQLYRLFMPYVRRLHLTVFDTEEVEGDTLFPVDLLENEFFVASDESFPADEKNPYPYRFVTYDALTEQGRYE